jgi:protein-S-isoprenylcysteine O-methyltransferase
VYFVSASTLACRPTASARTGSWNASMIGGIAFGPNFASVALAFNLEYSFPAAAMNAAPALRYLGIALFVAGLALRWYAIVHLGRFFTVNVSIAADHRLIDTGPYRIVRHPSYTGALMAFLGLGLCIANWASLLSLLVPICLAFLRRIHVEEAVLLQALGDQYRDYMRRTKRLIPAIY